MLREAGAARISAQSIRKEGATKRKSAGKLHRSSFAPVAEYNAYVNSEHQCWARNDQGADTESFQADQVFLYIYVRKFEIFDHSFRGKVIICNLKCYWNI